MVGRDVFQMRRRMSLACVLTVSPDQPGHRHLSFAAPSTQVIPSNFQIRGMHTIIRDHTTHHADFVFYADRLLRLVRVHTAWGTVGLLWRVSPLQSLRARRGHPQ